MGARTESTAIIALKNKGKTEEFPPSLRQLTEGACFGIHQRCLVTATISFDPPTGELRIMPFTQGSLSACPVPFWYGGVLAPDI